MLGCLFSIPLYFILCVAVINLFQAILEFDVRTIIAMLFILFCHGAVVYFMARD